MKLMRMFPSLLVVSLIFGLFSGYYVAHIRGELKYSRLESEHQQMWLQINEEYRDKIEKYRSVSEGWYEKYLEANKIYEDYISNTPSSVVERVYVKADCSKPSDRSGGLGNEETHIRYELHGEVVRGITKITKQAERDVEVCRTALHSLQDKININNGTKGK